MSAVLIALQVSLSALTSTLLFLRMREFRGCLDMGIEVWESGESLGLAHAMFQLFVWKDEGSTSPFWLGGTEWTLTLTGGHSQNLEKPLEPLGHRMALRGTLAS